MSKNTSLDFLKGLLKDTKDSILIFDTDLNICFLSQPLKLLLPELCLNQSVADYLPGDWHNNSSVIICDFESNITPVLDEQGNVCLYVLKFLSKYIITTYEYPFSSDVSRPAIIDLSHRFYTPLTIIFSSLIFLSKTLPFESLDEKTKKAFNTIRQNCYLLLKLVSNLSDIASSDPYDINTDLNLKTVNIVEYVKKTVCSLTEFSELLSIPITLNTPIPNIFISVDLRRLERIILILISNCFKYTKDNNKITVSLCETLNHIAISISDKGIGMSKDTINKIFTPYRSINESINKVNGSSLIVAKIFIEQLGGTMIIESNLDKGTKISFTISKNLTSGYNLESTKSELASQGLFAPKYIEFCDIIEYDNLLK